MDGTQQMVVDLDGLLQVTTEVDRAGAVTVTLVGELDHLGVEPVGEVLARTWAAWPAAVTVDLRGLDFINARGLACLLDASRTARSRGVPLVLRCSPGLVARMVALVGLGDRVAAVPPVAPVLALVPRPAPALVLVPADSSSAPLPRPLGAAARSSQVRNVRVVDLAEDLVRTGAL